MQTYQEIDPQAAQAWQKEQTAFFVDVREPQEHMYESIQGSLSMPLSVFEPALLPQGRKIVFYCEHGVRSAEAAKRFMAYSGTSSFSLKGGLAAWRDASLPTVGEKQAFREIPRRLKMTLGICIFFGSLLTVLFSSLLVIVPAFLGGALFYDGWKNNSFLSKLFVKYTRFSKKQ